MKRGIRFLTSVLVALILVVGLSGIEAKAAESQNQQLATYYATLAQMGGNESITKEQAQALADTYAQLAAAENGGTAVVPSSVALPQITNISASQEFYQKTCNAIINLPPQLREKLIKKNVQFRLYKAPGDYGMSKNNAGFTRYYVSWNGKKTTYSAVVDLAETSSISFDSNFVMAHEIGHAVDGMIYERTRKKGSDDIAFLQCLNVDKAKIREVAGYTNVFSVPAEYFADAFADFIKRPVEFQEKCPTTFAYMAGLKY